MKKHRKKNGGEMDPNGAEPEESMPKAAEGTGETDAPGVDVSQIDAGELDMKTFPATAAPEFRVVMSDKAFADIKKHAESDTTVELCGVLAGNLYKDESGPYLLIEEVIRGVNTRRSSSRVTFTHETWDNVHKVMEEDYPGLRIVGWYHTHPGFGIFLSEMDQFIQDNFFKSPHCVAFVYDPKADQRGLFVWRNGQSVQLRRYWLGREVCYDLGPEATVREEGMAAKPERMERDEEDREERRETRTIVTVPQDSQGGWWGALAVIGVVGIFVAFWMGVWSTRRSAEHELEKDKRVEALIKTGLFRDGLSGELARVSKRVAAAQSGVESVRREMVPETPAEDGGETPEADPRLEKLKEASDELTGVHQDLSRMLRAYTAADRLEARIGNVMSLIETLEGNRMAIATVCVIECDRLQREMAGRKAEERSSDLMKARQLYALAVRVAPDLKREIDQRLAPLLKMDSGTSEDEPEPDKGEK